jgi:5-methylthioadenosine/S-adenosylhomocysteine deaminase
MADELGSLEPGKLADLVVIDLQKPHLYPLIDPVAAAVNMAEQGDIDLVVVGGEVVVAHGRALRVDEASVLAGAQAAAEAVWGQLRQRITLPGR